MRPGSPILLTFLVALSSLCVLYGASARAEVTWEGDWPDHETVSLSLRAVSRSEAVRELADAAKWNYVARELGAETIELEVRDLPAQQVLAQLLSGADFVAHRTGDFVSINPQSPDRGAATDVAQASPTVSGANAEADRPRSAAPKKGEDLVVTEDVTIGPDEVVRDLFVWGGDVIVAGAVTQGVVVLGGSATFLDGSSVAGDVFGVGSTIEIKNGAGIDGEVAVLAGSLSRGDRVSVNCTTCDDPTPKNRREDTIEKIAGTLAEVSLLWVIGAILLAASLGRARTVRDELTKRPLRNLGIGALGLVGVVIVLLTLIVTLIGIPLAILAGVVAACLSYLGVCLVMYAAGTLLLRGEARNPYLQLALGCGAYFLLRLVPVAGSLAGFVAALLGVGGLISTRLGGLLRRGSAPGRPPSADGMPPPEDHPAGLAG